jgi:hypothetical protein
MGALDRTVWKPGPDGMVEAKPSRRLTPREVQWRRARGLTVDDMLAIRAMLQAQASNRYLSMPFYSGELRVWHSKRKARQAADLLEAGEEHILWALRYGPGHLAWANDIAAIESALERRVSEETGRVKEGKDAAGSDEG